MRKIAAYDARIMDTNVVRLSRCMGGGMEDVLVTDWQTAIEWLVQHPAGNDNFFTVVHSLMDFTRALFSLLPEFERKQIEQTDKIKFQDTKIFYVNGRYLGLTATLPINEGSNRFQRAEINIQALKWWLTEEDDPEDVKATYHAGTRILRVLDELKFSPTKLTSPVAVFTDCYIGDARKMPTIFSWPPEKHDAMDYATEIMRYEWRSAYQIGAFESTHLYDLVSAYPAGIAALPSTDSCRCEYATTRPEWAQWGLVYGEVDVEVDVSPLVYEYEDGSRINPVGKWKGYFTTGELNWLTKWKAGTYSIENGWWFAFGKERPYRDAMNWLFTYKNNPDKYISSIAKRMSQGVSGKLDEDRQDGKPGEYYNPVLACMVRSYCRMQVANFIYQHNLQDELIAVLVDSVLTSDKVKDFPPSNLAMGSWRYEGELPAIVLSKGNVWRPGKKPQGIDYYALHNALTVDPEAGYYEFQTANGGVRSIDLLTGGSEPDRYYGQYPECGAQVLAEKYISTAIEL